MVTSLLLSRYPYYTNFNPKGKLRIRLIFLNTFFIFLVLSGTDITPKDSVYLIIKVTGLTAEEIKIIRI